MFEKNRNGYWGDFSVVSLFPVNFKALLELLSVSNHSSNVTSNTTSRVIIYYLKSFAEITKNGNVKF